jgi:hypothetical protein
MKRSEIAILLTKVAAFDQRTIGEADVEAWAEVFEDTGVELPECMAAVTAHFKASTDRLMPNEIIRLTKAIRNARIKTALDRHLGNVPMPGDLDQVQERAWRKAWTAAVHAGHPDPIQSANDALGLRPLREALIAMPAEVREGIERFAKEHSV